MFDKEKRRTEHLAKAEDAKEKAAGSNVARPRNVGADRSSISWPNVGLLGRCRPSSLGALLFGAHNGFPGSGSGWVKPVVNNR